jgi:hypothetical protein
MKNSNDTIGNRSRDVPVCMQCLNHCATAYCCSNVKIKTKYLRCNRRITKKLHLASRCTTVSLPSRGNTTRFPVHIHLLTYLFTYLLRFLCGAGGYPSNVLQPTEAYCTNPALVSPSSLHHKRRSTSDDVRGLH